MPLMPFTIGEQRVPADLIRATAWIKWGAAWANCDLLRLRPAQAQAIAQAAEQVATGEIDAPPPPSLWRGDVVARVEDDMNEALAKLASRPPRGFWHEGQPTDAPTEVNLGQHAGPVFASAMQVAVALQAKARLLPALAALRGLFIDQTAGGSLGRGDAALALCEDHLRHALLAVHVLALGTDGDERLGEARPFDFGERLAARLALRLDLPLSHVGSPIRGQQTLVPLHAALRALALVLLHFGDHVPPTVTPNGSALRALAMVCVQVVGHDAAIGLAVSQAGDGTAFEPLILMNTLDSMRLLSDAMNACSQPHARAP